MFVQVSHVVAAKVARAAPNLPARLLRQPCPGCSESWQLSADLRPRHLNIAPGRRCSGEEEDDAGAVHPQQQRHRRRPEPARALPDHHLRQHPSQRDQADVRGRRLHAGGVPGAVDGAAAVFRPAARRHGRGAAGRCGRLSHPPSFSTAKCSTNVKHRCAILAIGKGLFRCTSWWQAQPAVLLAVGRCWSLNSDSTVARAHRLT